MFRISPGNSNHGLGLAMSSLKTCPPVCSEDLHTPSPHPGLLNPNLHVNIPGDPCTHLNGGDAGLDL